jgi:uncharacterized protein YcnI
LVRRIAIVLGSAAVLVAVMALPASAHVSIQPSTATKGSFATVAFQVPNEESAKTVKVEVQFPKEPAIADAAVQPVPGWKLVVKPAKLTTPITTDEGDSLSERVDTITWTADAGGGLTEGQFQQFLVSMALPDDVDVLQFPTIQTYDNGDEVRWIQQTPAGGPEPENPVPELKLVAGETEGGTTATTTPTSGGGTAAAASDVKKSDVDSAKTLAIVALIVGIVGLLAGVGGFAMGRRRTT